MKIYEVGGCVRDRLLGREPKDIDYVVVGGTRERLLEMGMQQVGKDFPVFIDPKTKHEYALARTDRKTGSGYSGFECDTENVTLEDDLLRRDLTINAIARDPEDGCIIDPFGGQEDLHSGVLRHVSDAFVEDPLRVLRVARFAARYRFRVHPDTNSMMDKIYMRGELQNLTPERVWTETWKAMAEDCPEVFFEVLKDCRGIRHVFPEIYRLYGVPQPAEHHPEGDAWTHTMMVVQAAKRYCLSPKLVFASLVHDLGKGVTPRSKWPKHIGHEKTGVPVFEEMADRLKIPTKIRDFASLVIRWHMHFHKVPDMKPGKIVKLLTNFKVRHSTGDLHDFCLVCRCDQIGRGVKTAHNTGLSELDYLMRCAHRMKSVRTRTEDRDGNPVKGKLIGQLLHQDMAEAIRAIGK